MPQDDSLTVHRELVILLDKPQHVSPRSLDDLGVATAETTRVHEQAV